MNPERETESGEAVRWSAWLGRGMVSTESPVIKSHCRPDATPHQFASEAAQPQRSNCRNRPHPENRITEISRRKRTQSELPSGLTTQAQRPGPRGRSIATWTRWPGSLQRMVRPRCLGLSHNGVPVTSKYQVCTFPCGQGGVTTSKTLFPCRSVTRWTFGL